EVKAFLAVVPGLYRDLYVGLVRDGLCFRSQRAEARFWAGASVLATRAASARFRRKTAAWARRCGRVRGRRFAHLSAADTARDLDHLRVLPGEEKLTYVGLSYGTYLGKSLRQHVPRPGQGDAARSSSPMRATATSTSRTRARV